MATANHYVDGVLVGTITVPDPVPLSLSKTAFRAHCVANLGGGMAGMLRFQQIIDGIKAGTGLIAFCHDEYVAADSFDKSKTDTFLSIIEDDHLGDGERTAILDNWPEQ